MMGKTDYADVPQAVKDYIAQQNKSSTTKLAEEARAAQEKAHEPSAEECAACEQRGTCDHAVGDGDTAGEAGLTEEYQDELDQADSIFYALSETIADAGLETRSPIYIGMKLIGHAAICSDSADDLREAAEDIDLCIQSLPQLKQIVLRKAEVADLVWRVLGAVNGRSEVPVVS